MSVKIHSQYNKSSAQKIIKKRTTWFYDDICNNNRNNNCYNTVDDKYMSFNRNAEYSRLVAKMPRIRSQNDGGLIEPRPKKEKIGTSRVRLFINISFFSNHLVIFSLFSRIILILFNFIPGTGRGEPKRTLTSERWHESER